LKLKYYVDYHCSCYQIYIVYCQKGRNWLVVCEAKGLHQLTIIFSIKMLKQEKASTSIWQNIDSFWYVYTNKAHLRFGNMIYFVESRNIFKRICFLFYNTIMNFNLLFWSLHMNNYNYITIDTPFWSQPFCISPNVVMYKTNVIDCIEQCFIYSRKMV